MPAPAANARDKVADWKFGRHVKSYRRARGMTQEVLAERSGLSADTIRRLENGSFSPSLHTLRKLCTGLDVRLSTLFEAFEIGEREPRAELGDWLDLIDESELELMLRLVFVLQGLIRARVEDLQPAGD